MNEADQPRKHWLLYALSLATLVCLSITLSAQSQLPLKQVASYCTDAAAYAQRHHDEALLFAAIPQNPSPARDHWRPVQSRSDLQTDLTNGQDTAEVNSRDGHTIYADFHFNNQFGDSSETAQYCFRPDGTLAQMHSELKSYHGGMRVVRDATYNAEGKQTSHSMKSFDLDSGKTKPLPSDFWDQPPPVFLHVRDLPFSKDLPAEVAPKSDGR